jgi:hypothetical protein
MDDLDLEQLSRLTERQQIKLLTALSAAEANANSAPAPKDRSAAAKFTAKADRGAKVAEPQTAATWTENPAKCGGGSKESSISKSPEPRWLSGEVAVVPAAEPPAG